MGKATQRQKNRRLKSRELRQNGSEKEDTDMDAVWLKIPCEKSEPEQSESGSHENVEFYDPNDAEEVTNNINVEDHGNIEYERKVEAPPSLRIHHPIPQATGDNPHFEKSSEFLLYSAVTEGAPRAASPLAGNPGGVLLQHDHPKAFDGNSFDVPGQNYRAHVGGGENNVGVPWDRGPPLFGGIQNIGQFVTGMTPKQGGQNGMQQTLLPLPIPGILSQQPQGSHQISTPPFHAHLPQEMEKLSHFQVQSVQQSVHVANQMRSMPQPYHQPATRHHAPNVFGYPGGQGSVGNQDGGMQSMGRGGGQPTAIFPHLNTPIVPPVSGYMPGQAPLHPSNASHYQQSAYTMNSHMQPHQFHGPMQGQQPIHQTIYLTQNFYGNEPGPMIHHHGNTHVAECSQNKWNLSGVGLANGGIPQKGNPLTGGLGGSTIVQEGNVQKPSQQPQPLMSLHLEQTGNQSRSAVARSIAKDTATCKGRLRRVKSLVDDAISKTAENGTVIQRGFSNNVPTLDPQDWSMEMIAEFTARITKTINDESESHSPVNNEQVQFVEGESKQKTTKAQQIFKNQHHNCDSSEKESSDSDESESATVVQTSEQNTELPASHECSEKRKDNTPVIQERNASEEPNENDIVSKELSLLEYTHMDDQWNPSDKNGEKVYDRDFLIHLQSKPNSKIRPMNLPDLDIVLKDISENRGTLDLEQSNDASLGRVHFYRTFPRSSSISSNSSNHALTLSQGSLKEISKSNEPTVIDEFSIKEDIQLRETENAWRPSRLKSSSASQEDAATETLYKTVRRVLNKLMPPKLNRLISQIRVQQIDSEEKLQRVVDMVFEKAICEPSFMAVCARMCKKLAKSNFNFGKLITTRCQLEFKKCVDANTTAIQTNKIEEHKELPSELANKEKKVHVKYFGTIIFIGMLYKQKMFETNIIHECIEYLLTRINDESLECLCKLLTTVGAKLERKNQNLEPYFKQMSDVVDRKVLSKVSSRVRFMVQDLIELRMNKWISRRSYSEIEIEEKEEPTGWPIEAGAWSQMVRDRPQYAVHISKLENRFTLEFVPGDRNGSIDNSCEHLSLQQFHDQLLSLMVNEKENSFDNIYSWITANVIGRVSEPDFIKVLMTAILQVSIEPYNNTWKFRVDKFQDLQTLIPWYIDANINLLELQYLIAIQEYLHQLEDQQRVLLQIIERQVFESILPFDVFHAWEKNEDLTPLAGKSIAMMAFKSFFTSLRELDAESSHDETKSQVSS